MTARRRRGADTQRIAAAYAAAHGWPGAYSTGSSVNGRDINGMPGISPEVKASHQDNFSITGSLRQSIKNAKGDLPIVVYRPAGYGPEKVADWPAVIPYGWLLRLLRQAGYGDPMTPQDPEARR